MRNSINSKINKIRAMMVTLIVCTTYILCGGTVVASAFPILVGMNVNVNNMVEVKPEDIKQIPQEITLTPEEKFDKISVELDKQISQTETMQTQYDELVAIDQKTIVHVENCLWEDCGVQTCMTNKVTALDYDYSNTHVLYTNEDGNDVYGIGAIRKLDVDRERFIRTLAPFAQSSQKEFGIPASTILAQAILESGWGKKVIGNNLFGIKATPSYKGPIVMTGTLEYDSNGVYSTAAYFRGYESIGEAVYDYSKNVILGNPKLYSGVVTDNWIDSVYGLGAYATDPVYFDLVISVIQDFNLTKYNDLSYTIG